ncbi:MULTISPECIES: fimbrial protein [unclassified Pseudocitrobacter]|uniref:fimbrial protein n=1 Tax=unclassified Pseudocitrobacter TaxID=2638778 RepID=UPI0023E3D04D|nr:MULTISPECIES: fimbrial protein [unclassified Pseudocitrobacter]MDF3826133.1 fimbrial protein [Pseudocitrobacter sp. 2023EL-00150]MEC5371952.1 fimbrial protein [Pseudocitrobacter sp. MW920760]
MKSTQFFIFALMTCSSFAFAHDGTVNISGMFRSNTCILAQDSRAIQVSLGTLSISQFAQGHASAEKAFVINLEQCGADVSAANVTFSGESDSAMAELLAIETGSGAATGLAVALLDDHQALIPLKQESKPYPLKQGKVALTFYAQLRSTVGDVTSGAVNASATFVVRYD